MTSVAPLTEGKNASIAEFVPELDRLAADVMADWKVPGAAPAVVQDGKIALAKAYGQRDVETNLPVTATTQFLIGSITKSFTATGVALLHNEGRLDWTKPVRDYIHEFRLHDPVATERITIRDLLSHQSGLPRHDWVHLPGDRAPAELLGVMRYLEPSRDIRSAYQYNNLCYNVAGLLIERFSGQSYAAFIRARLTDRLGMTVGFTLDDLEASADAARPYMMHEDTRLPAMRLPIQTIAGGAINTSVADIASWMRLHLGKGEFDGERWGSKSASIGSIDYRRCLTFGAAKDGLYIRPSWFFRLWHPPLFIPWTDVNVAHAQGWVFRYLDLRFAYMPKIRVRVAERLGSLLLSAGGRPLAETGRLVT